MPTTEIRALRYTNEDWIRVAHENILWAEDELQKATDLRDRIHWTWYIEAQKRFLREVDPQNPYALSNLVKRLAHQLTQAERHILYLEHKLDEFTDQSKKRKGKVKFKYQ